MSINSQELVNALNALNIPHGKIVRYENVAKSMGFTPVKIVKGKKTTQKLEVGGKAYKEAVYNEVIKRRQEQLSKIKKQNVEVSQVGISKKNERIAESLKSKGYTKYQFEYDGISNLEDYYNVIKNELDNTSGEVLFVSFPFLDKESGKVMWRSMGVRDFDIDYDFFVGEYVKTMEGKVGGSDPISSEEYSPFYDVFTFTTISSNNVEGSSEDMMFEVKGIESKKKLCVYESLLSCGYNCKNFGFKPEDLRDIRNLTKLIDDNKLPISVIMNGFTIKPEFNIRKIKYDSIIDIKYKQTTKKEPLWNITDNDINLIYLYESEIKEHYIIYDEVNNHCDYVINEPKLLPSVKIANGRIVYKNDKQLFTGSQLRVNNLVNTKTPIKYVFFDYETVIDFNSHNCMKAYSLSILVLEPIQLKMLEELDLEYRKVGEEGKILIRNEINEIRKNNCITFKGYECNDRFIEWFLQNQNDNLFVFVGFNNCNFDNFIMLNAFLQYNQENKYSEINVDNVFYSGSQLLNFRISGRHTFFDIRKHLMGSLKKNCESFKITCCAKKEFNHDYAQSLHDDGLLLDYINDNEELQEYNEFDVLSTAVLYKRYANALANIPSTTQYSTDLYNTKTIGSLIYKVFTQHKIKEQFDLPKLTFQQYKDLQKSKIAGRVEMFNGVQKVQEKLVSTDVCSLYPYVMSVHNCYYPCGDIQEVNEYRGDDTIGFYYCDIDQSNLKDLNLPNIYALKSETENDWSYDGVIENYLISNVMIRLLRKFGCRVEVKNGFIFTERKKSCDMFRFLLDMMKSKNYQDLEAKKEKKGIDNEYNPALRETYKLLMNSLSGKVIEGLHTEKTIDIDTMADYLKIQEKSVGMKMINAIGNKMFITYEVDAETMINKQRPIYLGVLIYDYAKSYMYENSYSKIGKSQLLYTDTDASKFRHSDFIGWKNWVDTNNIIVPHWEEVEEYDNRYKTHKIYEEGSKVFGSFEDELEDCNGDEYVFYCLQKKSWLYGYKKDGEWNVKYRFKGINGSAQLLNLDEEEYVGFAQLLNLDKQFITKKVINHNDGTEEIKYVMKPESEYDVYKYYISHKENNIESGNEIDFFEKIYTEKEGYVLCSSFRKIVKNNSRNVGIDDNDKFNTLMNNIQVNYIIKKIKI